MDKKEILLPNETIREVVSELVKIQVGIPGQITSIEELKKILSDIINNLITTDFSRLISILYRLDISEKKLRQLLSNSLNKPGGDIIAEMIIKRQEEKIKTRKIFSANHQDCDEEKW